MVDIPPALKNHLLGIEDIFHQSVQEQVKNLEDLWQKQFDDLDQERGRELEQALANERREREMKEKSMEINRKLDTQIDQLRHQLSESEKRLEESRKEAAELRRRNLGESKRETQSTNGHNGANNGVVEQGKSSSKQHSSTTATKTPATATEKRTTYKKSSSSTLGSTSVGGSYSQHGYPTQSTIRTSQVSTTSAPIQYIANPGLGNTTFIQQQNPMGGGGAFYQNQQVPQAPQVMFGNPFNQGGAFTFYPAANPPTSPPEEKVREPIKSPSHHADSESSQIFDAEAEMNMRINAKKGPFDTVLPAGAKPPPVMQTMIPSNFKIDNKDREFESGAAPTIPTIPSPRNDTSNPMKTILPAGFASDNLPETELHLPVPEYPQVSPPPTFSIEPSEIRSSERLNRHGVPRFHQM